MKKLVSFVLVAAVLAVSGVGCGDSTKKDTPAEKKGGREIPKDNK